MPKPIGSKNKHPRPDKGILKQFCSKGHDKNIVGRTTDNKCRLCVNDRSLNRYKVNRETINAIRRFRSHEYDLLHPRTVEQKLRKKFTDKLWFKENRASVNVRKIKDQTNRQLRVVAWTDWDKIKEFYKNCPKGMEVDHIIPLQGKLISGLHVSWNLQYLTPEQNRKKRNKFKILVSTI